MKIYRSNFHHFYHHHDTRMTQLGSECSVCRWSLKIYTKHKIVDWIFHWKICEIFFNFSSLYACNSPSFSHISLIFQWIKNIFQSILKLNKFSSSSYYEARASLREWMKEGKKYANDMLTGCIRWSDVHSFHNRVIDDDDKWTSESSYCSWESEGRKKKYLSTSDDRIGDLIEQ